MAPHDSVVQATGRMEIGQLSQDVERIYIRQWTIQTKRHDVSH
jgi:hypothetical protein